MPWGWPDDDERDDLTHEDCDRGILVGVVLIVFAVVGMIVLRVLGGEQMTFVEPAVALFVVAFCVALALRETGR